jgi:predicted MFS family arabinose efflux permease
MGAMIGVVCNTLLIGPLRRHFSERTLLTSVFLGFTASFLVLSQTSTYYELLAVMVPIGLVGTLFTTVSGSALSNAVSTPPAPRWTPPGASRRASRCAWLQVADHEAGTAVSIQHSVRSATGLLAPPLGGYLLATYGFSMIGLAAAATCAVAAIYFLAQPQPPTKPEPTKDE